MRTTRQHFTCRFCGEIPRQLVRYRGLAGMWPKLFRHYECRMCGGHVYSERVTQVEFGNGQIEMETA